MIKNSDLFKKFEDRFIKDSGILTHNHGISIVEALWNEGVLLGVLPPKDPLEGIEVDKRIARILNACSKRSSHG